MLNHLAQISHAERAMAETTADLLELDYITRDPSAHELLEVHLEGLADLGITPAQAAEQLRQILAARS